MNDTRTMLRLEVTIHQEGGSFGSVRFNEDLPISAENFQDLSAILSRFHDLFEEIRKQQQKAGGRKP